MKDATFDNGLLKIELVREIPEAMKPRRIAINGASHATTCTSSRQSGLSSDVKECAARRPTRGIPLRLRMEETMRPTTAFDDNVFDFNALLHPGTVFDHPRTWWHIPRCRSPRSAPSWRPGHPTHRRSPPALRCGRRQASRRPSPSTTSLKPCANSTGARAIRRAESQTVCVRRPGPGGVTGRGAMG